MNKKNKSITLYNTLTRQQDAIFKSLNDIKGLCELLKEKGVTKRGNFEIDMSTLTNILMCKYSRMFKSEKFTTNFIKNCVDVINKSNNGITLDTENETLTVII